MSVKSRIAAFEHQNEAVRFECSPKRLSQNDPSSVTELASKSRRSRLRKEHQKESNQHSSSLSERRKARQLRKRQQVELKQQDEQNSERFDNPDFHTEDRKHHQSTAFHHRNQREREQRQRSQFGLNDEPQQRQSLSSFYHQQNRSPVPSPQRQIDAPSLCSHQRAQSYGKREQVYTNHPSSKSNRRGFPRNPETETRRVVQLAFPQADLQQITSRSRSLRNPRDEYPDYNNLQLPEDDDDDDDEQTQTSVRQIMKSTPHQNATISSSSFDTKTHDDIHPSFSTSAAPIFSSQSCQDEEQNDDKSMTYEQRRQFALGSKNDTILDQQDSAPSALLNRDDLQHYRKSLDTPVVKTAASVAAAATVGTMLLGPVGLLVGAATVGIGVGVMQIPEEQRANVREKASNEVKKFNTKVLDVSERFSYSCAAGFEEAGVVDQFPNEIRKCFEAERPTPETNSIVQGVAREKAGHRDTTGIQTLLSAGEGRHTASPTQRSNNRRVACLRNVRIVQVNQIHGLDPVQQPRAWLDVMASNNTTRSDKNEAMEEILILSKDKRHARLFLEEGILDSLMYIVTRFFENAPRGKIPTEELIHARLAASCLITLGKAHCAAVHTGGDLLLMSLYEHGSVPEERQLAQMLYEVPHHVWRSENETFVLQRASMPAAEEMAGRIKQLSRAD